MREENLLIGGRFQAAKDGRRFERSNPVTGEVVCHAAAATVDDVDQAVNAAQAAFPAWAALAPGERRMLLLKAADLLDARTAEFISIGVSETGGTPGWYGFNVMLAANI